MPVIVINRIRGWHRFPVEANSLAGIQVSIETREVAAADFQPQTVSLKKDIRRGPQVNAELVYLAWIHELRLLLGTPIACANNSLGQVLSKSIRPHVDEFGSEVGIN